MVVLEKIPEVLSINGTLIYQCLRGVCCYHEGMSRLRSSVGHYTAHCKRLNGNWEIMDDLKKKPVPVKRTKKIPAEYLLYTI